MSGSDQVQEVISTLGAAKASIRCEDMRHYLQSLGFQVRDGRKPGHKVFTHPGLEGFLSGGYTCGHGRNPEIKPAYVTKVISLLRRHETELAGFLERSDEH